jgi:hypothetical protein
VNELADSWDSNRYLKVVVLVEESVSYGGWFKRWCGDLAK